MQHLLLTPAEIHLLRGLDRGRVLEYDDGLFFLRGNQTDQYAARRLIDHGLIEAPPDLFKRPSGRITASGKAALDDALQGAGL